MITLPTPTSLQAMPPPTARRGALQDLCFNDWLQGHADAMFRWALSCAGAPWPGANRASRRAFAELGVAARRRLDDAGWAAWLYDELLRAALRHGRDGGLPDARLAGLPPELRCLLRLVARGALSTPHCTSLLPLRMGRVRADLLQARLRSTVSPAERAESFASAWPVADSAPAPLPHVPAGPTAVVDSPDARTRPEAARLAA